MSAGPEVGFLELDAVDIIVKLDTAAKGSGHQKHGYHCQDQRAPSALQQTAGVFFKGYDYGHCLLHPPCQFRRRYQLQGAQCPKEELRNAGCGIVENY